MIGGAAVPERIAALVSADSISGPARQLTALAGALRDVGTECLVVVFRRSGRSPGTLPRYLDDAGIAHTVVDDQGPADWRMATRVRDVLTRWRPSILQTHGYKATAVAYWLRKLRFRPPWVGFFHGSTAENLKTRWYHWIDRRLLAAAERVVVMSRAQAAEFRHCGRRVRVIHNAALATPAAGDPSDRARWSALTRDLPRPRIGVVGRLSPEKGVDLFLDACALLMRDGVACSAVVVGDGPERARLAAQCRRLGLESRVAFAGQTSDVDVVYRDLDLVVLPSRSEGLPNTLLEAMWADVPAVATAVGAVPEVVGTSAAARLVAPGSAAALADAIHVAITNEDSAEARAARRAAVSRFSLERRVQAHIELYREVLEDRHPRGEEDDAACAASLEQ